MNTHQHHHAPQRGGPAFHDLHEPAGIDSPAATVRTSGPVSEGMPGADANLDNVRVLVVDDVADAADTLACLLEMNGYEVHTAHDGAAALALIARWTPLCVILDIDMPGMDGLELAKHLRAEHGDNVVLIAVTGWNRDDPRVAETFSIVDHYLRKPVDPAVLDKLLPQV